MKCSTVSTTYYPKSPCCGVIVRFKKQVAELLELGCLHLPSRPQFSEWLVVSHSTQFITQLDKFLCWHRGQWQMDCFLQQKQQLLQVYSTFWIMSQGINSWARQVTMIYRYPKCVTVLFKYISDVILTQKKCLNIISSRSDIDKWISNSREKILECIQIGRSELLWEAMVPGSARQDDQLANHNMLCVHHCFMSLYLLVVLQRSDSASLSRWDPRTSVNGGAQAIYFLDCIPIHIYGGSYLRSHNEKGDFNLDTMTK